LVGSGRMVGERLSSSGTRLDTCSPLGLAKSSTESLRPRPFKSVSRQSLLDIVTSKLGVARKTPHQRYLSRWRDSMSAASGGCVTRGVASEMDLSRRPGGGGGGGGRRPNQSGPGAIRPPKLLTAATPTSVASGGGGHPPSSRSFSLVFDPAGRLCYYWSMVVSIAFLYNFWVIIYRFAFQEINSTNRKWDLISGKQIWEREESTKESLRRITSGSHEGQQNFMCLTKKMKIQE
ncbi:unnamed protein product, partial [Nesidiocoris tenuis]